MARHPDLRPPADILVLRVESGLWFANADTTRDAVRAALTPTTAAVVLDCETTPIIDATAAAMLLRLRKDLDRRHVRLLIAKSVGEARELLSTDAMAGELGPLYRTVGDAVSAFRLGRDEPPTG